MARVKFLNSTGPVWELRPKPTSFEGRLCPAVESKDNLTLSCVEISLRVLTALYVILTRVIVIHS